ncbi:MAG: CueP family metal-binding protein [Paenibacillus sp.]|nr:CueP family metal-binding protein [Paenibacillus sp.]
MNKKVFITTAIVIILVGVALGTYSIADEGKTDPIGEELAQTNDIKKLVNDYSIGNVKAKSASITSNQLTVTRDNDQELTYSLPRDEFFVSIAPYVSQTHPCTIHNLAGCQGEMANTSFNVTVTDHNNKVIMKDVIKSHNNGFIDLWLPRDQTFHVTIDYDGKSSTSSFTTSEGDNTCITTMQLS